MTIRLSTDEKNRIDALVAQIPGAKRSGIVRSLLAGALDAIGDDARRLVRPPAGEGESK